MRGGWTVGAVLAVAVGIGAAIVSVGRASDPAPKPASAHLKTATFAGGCFWCMEPPFDALPGVVSTTSGYTGGTLANPTYEQVSSGGTGHAESVQILYDPTKVTYEKLLETYWHNVDPLTPNAQFCDHGEQYRTAIFAADDEQMSAALASKTTVRQRLNRPVVTEVVKAGIFYPAEEYHQDYYKKNPIRYRFYRSSCGRDPRLQEIWGNDAPSH